MSEIKDVFDKVKSLDLNVASIDEIKDILNPLFQGYETLAPQLESGTELYSARIGDKPVNIAEVIYPQADLASLGPANRHKNPVLYCSSSRHNAILEVQPREGDIVSIVHWKTTSLLVANQIGYTRRVFDALGSSRSIPIWQTNSRNSSPEQEVVTNFLSDTFTCIVSTQQSNSHNKLRAAIAEKLFEDDIFNGLLYPSIQACANTDIIVVKPRSVDTCLKPTRVECVQIISVRESIYEQKVIDVASVIDSRKNIIWSTKPSKSELGYFRRYGTIGWQEFLRQKKDILSDYDSAKESNSNRPIQTEHGNVAEASFRKWLIEYLPKKYGVTSGYIIPDIRSADYTILHYDVIIYDILNSPVLWGSNNADHSDQGRARAIPAEYVHAVFEVKSTLTKVSINDALKKLKELDDYRPHLTKNFCSGIIFFELKQKDILSCKIAEGLYAQGIPGYFGGLILRAEGIDSNLTGSYTLTETPNETVVDMPLVREIGILHRNVKGDVILIDQGDCVNAFSQDGIWNFDKGYRPIIKNVALIWAYNSFPCFFVDLVERLQGTYSLGDCSSSGSYGMSFER